MDPTIPWSIWDIIKDIDPMTLWTTKKTGAAGQLPAENQAPHGMKYPPRMLRPATSIFTCAIFMLAVDPNHLAVMEDDEHVFLFTNIYI